MQQKVQLKAGSAGCIDTNIDTKVEAEVAENESGKAVDQNANDAMEETSDHPLPLTAAQAATLRQQPGFQKGAVSASRLLFWQLGAGLAVAGLTGMVTQQLFSVVSALYGMLAVVVPGAVFVWGLRRWQQLAQRAGANAAGGMLAGFFVWEFVKVVLTIVMLALAVKIGVPIHWPALLAGFVVTLKMHWLALWLSTKSSAKVRQNV